MEFMSIIARATEFQNSNHSRTRTTSEVTEAAQPADPLLSGAHRFGPTARWSSRITKTGWTLRSVSTRRPKCSPLPGSPKCWSSRSDRLDSPTDAERPADLLPPPATPRPPLGAAAPRA